MELLEGLRTRKSIRAYKPDPVPRKLLLEVLDAARWSPSWGNTQPWELAVVGGDTVKRLTADLVAAFEQKTPPAPDVPMPQTFPDACQKRYMACAAGLFGAMGIAREDKARRFAHLVNMTRAFGAPAIIYVTFSRELTVPYTMLDLGLIIHGICLAAHAHGLGTCIEAQLALYPDLVRRHLNLPESQKIVVGLALGYPDPQAPANAFRTHREPLDKFVTWVDY
ncbi:MAG: nitroreductase [Deltaproteobacteria bacterium]|nr:nitroreductase [Deltaproteobacteria bacterium]